ncbi:MAG TPA: acyltransferase [Micromonosporaceae bacterium]|nr:acyltransferase [Micromonosporaceae bacterium]
MRAIAVLTVLGFHAGVPFFAGGFIGVDVFFVISGFLITGLLLSQDRIRLGEFYARRARRILPAAAVVLVGTAIASWMLLPPLRQRDVAWDVVGSALNVANWRFIAGQTDYLAAGQAHSPLLHYWSLAVEEQFYLLWAPLLLVISLVSRRLIAPVMAVFTAGSFALSLYWTGTSEPLAYLSSPSRAWQFGLGGLLALALARQAVTTPQELPLRRRRFQKLLWSCAGVGGAAAIVVATVVFTPETAFPGWAALLPTLGAVAIIAAGPSSFVGRFLSLRRVRSLGRLSFAWYLWHWPVLVLAEARLGSLDWGWKLLLVLASAIPAWLTMKLVEIPLRRSKALSVSPRPSLSFGATMVVVPVALALVLGSLATRSMTNFVTTAPASLIGAQDGPNLTVVPANGIYPAPLEARKDHPQVGECQVEPSAITSPACRFGSGAERIVLFGDSHASQWFPVALRIAAARGWSVEVLTKSGCPVPQLKVTNPQLGREYRECDQWREHALQRIASGTPPKLIVVGTLNRYASNAESLVAAWQEPLARLVATGARVAYLRDTPFPAKDVPTCLSGALQSPQVCAFPRDAALWVDPVADEVLAGRHAGAVVVNVNDVLCPGSSCPTVLDGVVLYRDDAHLTNTAVTLLTPRIEQALVGYGVLP